MRTDTTEQTGTGRRRRTDGERSRDRILEVAARMATVEGIDGLSIGRLADQIGMSKSGLFAHFGSKEELQLAAIDKAEEIFDEDVLEPALAASPGLERLRALCERFLSHVERRVFPAGCFFSSVGAELSTRPGPLRDRVFEVARGWMALLVENVEEAQRRGQIDPAADPEQLAFELDAIMAHGDLLLAIQGEQSLERARRGLEDRLARA